MNYIVFILNTDLYELLFFEKKLPSFVLHEEMPRQRFSEYTKNPLNAAVWVIPQRKARLGRPVNAIESLGEEVLVIKPWRRVSLLLPLLYIS